MTEHWEQNIPNFAIGSSLWPGLAKLAEECGELVQVIGKIMAMGGNLSKPHWDGTSLTSRLQEEMGDVLAAIAYTCDENISELNVAAVVQRDVFKQQTFADWHMEARGMS